MLRACLEVEVVEPNHGVGEPLAALIMRYRLDGHLMRVHDRAVWAVVHHHVQFIDGRVVDHVFERHHVRVRHLAHDRDLMEHVVEGGLEG